MRTLFIERYANRAQRSRWASRCVIQYLHNAPPSGCREASPLPSVVMKIPVVSGEKWRTSRSGGAGGPSWWGALLTSPVAAQPVALYWDVLPILQRNCHERLRPGEVGPIPLLTTRKRGRLRCASARRSSSAKDAVLVRRSRRRVHAPNNISCDATATPISPTPCSAAARAGASSTSMVSITSHPTAGARRGPTASRCRSTAACSISPIRMPG